MALAKKKLEDTEFMKVIIENRDETNETRSGFVGANNIVIDGSKHIKHYRFELGKEVELPVPCVEQLKKRAHVRLDPKTNRTKNYRIYTVEAV